MEASRSNNKNDVGTFAMLKCERIEINYSLRCYRSRTTLSSFFGIFIFNVGVSCLRLYERLFLTSTTSTLPF